MTAIVKLHFIVVLLLGAGISQLALGADLHAGKTKAQAVCQTCHGLDGQATLVGAPHLSGQRRDYLEIQLKAYRSGKRQHPQMSIIAGMLSDSDIENLAKWYSSIRIKLEMPAN